MPHENEPQTENDTVTGAEGTEQTTDAAGEGEDNGDGEGGEEE